MAAVIQARRFCSVLPDTDNLLYFMFKFMALCSESFLEIKIYNAFDVNDDNQCYCECHSSVNDYLFNYLSQIEH